MRLIIGIVLCIAAIAGSLVGFVWLTMVLENDGYGTPAVRNALFVLGGAGALLGAGISTIIWDISKRYEKPTT
jgi:hypothetical protein